MSNSVNDDAEISAAMAAATVDTSEVEEESKVRKVTKEGTQGRRAVKASAEAPRMESKKIGGDSYVARTSNPPWLEQRKQVYDMISERRLKESLEFQRVPIYVTLPNGDILRENSKTGLPYEAWRTSPFDVAATISQGLADAAVVARVTYADFVPDYSLSQDGMDTVDTMLTDVDASEEWEEDEDEAKTAAPVISTTVGTFLWDMTRPLVGNVAKMEFLKFEEDPDARTVFWHSSAHMLGEALEHLFGCRLTIGPPLAGGFYYDSYMGMESFSDADYKPIEEEVSKISKQKQAFERMVVTKEEALQLFQGNPFKEQIIRTKIPDKARTTVYRCGDLIDLCRGPHVSHTGKVKAFATTRHSASQWLGDTENDSLQRLYGISFPDKKQLKAWEENQKKAKERDHRRIGAQQQLIMFHDLSPGSAFWLPHGARIYNTLIQFIKDHYWKKGYEEIITPNIYNLDLWHQSGHALHYKDAMFCFNVENQEFAMKPMNCPGHCLMFAGQIRSYRDLPLRFADFGVLHRNELSGALSGLTRVRRFQQDDAHIFCREDQIESEVFAALNFMKEVYDTFGMSYKLALSTRPKKALGEKELWDKAEKALASAMNAFAGKGGWKVNPGDGAFYGPKIDIVVTDAMDRNHQCATIQLDFQLPIRFNLEYNTGSKEKGKEFARPVMVHRAMLGSVERMFAVLCEHFGGKWPLWLSPRQVMVIPVHADFYEYCESIRRMLHDERFFADVDLSKETFQKKVRNAQVAQYNFQLVVGQNEATNGTVNVRTRENVVEGEMEANLFVQKLKELRATYQ